MVSVSGGDAGRNGAAVLPEGVDDSGTGGLRA
jgi:hypothetical protein